MVFGEINSALSIFERIHNWLRPNKTTPENTLSSRFFQIFEHHGVHRNQIPRFFGHGLSLADVKDEDSILSKLNEEILNDVCELFAVRREWLDGSDNQIYPRHHFYKYPEQFEAFICGIQNKSPEPLHVLLIVSYSKFDEEDALLILEETIAYIGEMPIYRYHLSDGWVFKYWQCRAYLAACMALASKNKLWIRGSEVHINEINRLKDGCEFIYGRESRGYSTNRWYPEDMALSPKAYLDRLDPEIDNFGFQAALSLWLKLFDEGFMNTGMTDTNTRSNFADALSAIQNK